MSAMMHASALSRGRNPSRPRVLVAVFFLVLAAVLLVTASHARAAGGVMVADVTGSATLDGAPVDLMAELSPGQSVRLEDGASLVVIGVDDGSEFRVTGPGLAAVTDDGVTAAEGAALATAEPRLASVGTLDIGTVQQAAVVMRGAAPNALDMEPDGVMVLQPPVLTWAATPGAGTMYQVTILGPDHGIAHAAEAEEPGLVPPADAVAAPGLYSWSVSHLDGGKITSASATFRVPTPEAREAIATAALAFGDDVAGRVQFGRFLDKNGVDSRAVWQELAERRPDSARIAILASR